MVQSHFLSLMLFCISDVIYGVSMLIPKANLDLNFASVFLKLDFPPNMLCRLIS